jgi:DNA-binding LacI/PurR family transcriptional regulator
MGPPLTAVAFVAWACSSPSLMVQTLPTDSLYSGVLGSQDLEFLPRPLCCRALHSKRVTVYDIAEKAGVSHTTVALALRNHHRISEKRRVQIQRIAKQMGYEPDPFLSTLAAYRAQIQPAKVQSAIAWINHWEQPERLRGAHREFDAYWHGAESSARRFGYRLEEICWEPKYSARRFEQILLTRGIRGVLVPPHAVVPDWGDFDWSKFSVIRFGLSVPKPDSHLVTADQLRAVLMGVRRIKELGYQRVGLVMPEDTDQRLGGNFIGGFAAARQFFQLPALPPLLTEENCYREKPDMALRLLRQWLKRHQPDALLTFVTQVPGMLRSLGCRIPQDIAVAGTGIDVPVDAGLDQHSEAIGRMAVEMLVSQINLNERGEPADPCRILIESRWRDGSSLPAKKPME